MSISGDVCISKFGSYSYSGHAFDQPTASVVVKNDEANRYDLPGPAGGSGSLSATTVDAGAVNATYNGGGNGSENVTLNSEWTC